MNIIGQPESVVRYKHLRAAGKEFIRKLHQVAMQSDFDILKAAKKLTIPVQGRTLIFEEGETDTTALADFALHDFRAGGRRPVDCCAPEAEGFSADEKALLEAHRTARTSLFDVVSIDTTSSCLRLRDVLEPGEDDVMLTDISLSSMESLPGNLLIFLRVVSCQGLQMSSGCLFGFSTRHRDRLLAEFSARMKNVPPSDLPQRRFIFFYQRHREFGEDQAYA